MNALHNKLAVRIDKQSLAKDQVFKLSNAMSEYLGPLGQGIPQLRKETQ